MAQLKCIVVTPESTVLDEPAEFIALPLYDGEIGVAPAHSPLIGRLGFGEMRIKHAGQTSHWYVDGGFVQVVADVVTVLTNRALPAAQVNSQSAAEQLAASRTMKANSTELLAIRDRMQSQARAQLRVAGRAK
jgi:F-type H+-transporting ATPase subunit epsilon